MMQQWSKMYGNKALRQDRYSQQLITKTVYTRILGIWTGYWHIHFLFYS